MASIGLLAVGFGVFKLTGGLTLGVVGAIGLSLAGVVGGALDNAFVFPALFGADSPKPADLGSVGITFAEEGQPVSYVIGPRARIPGRVIHVSPKRDVFTAQGSGKQGETTTQTSYVDVLYAAAWNTTSHFERVDFDGQPVYHDPTTRETGELVLYATGSAWQIDVGFEDVAGGENRIVSTQNWSHDPGFGGVFSPEFPEGAWFLDTWYMTIEGRPGVDTSDLANFISGFPITVTQTVGTSFPATHALSATTPTSVGTVDARPIVIESRIVGTDPTTSFQRGRLVLDMWPWVLHGNGAGQSAQRPREGGSQGPTFWAGPIAGPPGPQPQVAHGKRSITNPLAEGGYPFDWPRPQAPGIFFQNFKFEQTPEGWREDVVDEASTEFFNGSRAGGVTPTPYAQKSGVLESERSTEKTPGMPLISYLSAANLNASLWGQRVPQPTFIMAGTVNAGQLPEYTVAQALHTVSRDLAGIPKRQLDFGWDEGTRTASKLAGPMKGVSTTALEQPGTPITTMLMAYDLQMASIDGKVTAFEAANRPVVEVDHLHLDASDIDARPGSRFQFNEADPASTPQRVHIRFLSADKSLQYGNEHDSWDNVVDITTGVDRTTTQIDTGKIVLSNVEAKQIARRVNRDTWLRQKDVTLRLPGKYMFLAPGAVLSFRADTSEFETPFFDRDWWIIVRQVDIATDFVVHVTGSVSYENPCVTIEENEDFASAPEIATPVARATAPALIQSIDIAPVNDRDANTPGVYLAMASSSYRGSGGSAGWGLWEALSDGSGYQKLGAATGLTTIGFLDETLLATQTSTIDWGQTLRVRVFGDGELNSVTRTDLDAGANRAALGDQIIQFLNATLVADQTYELTGILHGRLGTEQAAVTYYRGTRFVLLNDNLQLRSFDNSVRGATREYIAATAAQITKGRVSSSARVTIAANTNRSLAPTHFHYRRNGDGDVIMTWVRQSRTSFRTLSPDGAPLPEVTLEYDMVIDPDGVARAKNGLTAATATYTAAEQSTDSLTGEEFDVLIDPVDPSSGRGQSLSEKVKQEFGQLLDENGTDVLTAEDDRTFGTEN